MGQIFLVGVSAGVAAALLFASMASGSLFALLLFYLSALPILIAAMGWTYWAGLIATLTATVCLGLVFGPFFAVAFFLGIGLPAWWLGYLALLARSAQGLAHDTLEWYPLGRIVLWAAAVAAISVVISIPYFGSDAESFRANLRAAIETTLGLRGQDGPDKIIDADLLATLAPPMVACLTMIVVLVNVWLAARIVKVSGQLRRPWPDVTAISFPPSTPLFLAGAIAGIFLPGLFGIISDIFAATLMMAYAMLGLAVLHVITRANSMRGLMLTVVYAMVIIFGWPALILAVLGLVDTVLDLRGKAARQHGPPSLN